MKILILYSTVDGHTQAICEYIQHQLQQLCQQSVGIDALLLDDFYKQTDARDKLAAYDALILGASIRYGKHRPLVNEFITEHKAVLSELNTGFFSVNLVARKDEKNTADTNPYVIKFLQQTDWQPDVVDVFAGKLDYPRYRFVDKSMIKLIMWMTKGPTRGNQPIVFTNYKRVDAFCQQMIQSIC